jgi:uncharacterized repeat protein (TIGR01451 family)
MRISLILLLMLAGCQSRQADIVVLGDESQQVRGYVVNGGRDSTEVVYEDAKGKKSTAASNVIRVPILERCEEPTEKPKKDLKEIPEEKVITPIEEEKKREEEKKKKEEAPPERFYTVDVNTFSSGVAAVAYQLPIVSYRTEIYVPRTPPKIKLQKSSDEDRLCCDRQLTFRIKYTNVGGQDAHNVIVSDKIPLHVVYVEDSAGAAPHSAKIAITRDDQARPEKITWHVEGPIPSGGSGEAYYTVVCPPTRPKLLCYIRFEPKMLQVGEEGKIVCTVANRGNGTAEGVNVEITIPAGIEYEGQSLGKKEMIALGKIEADKTATKEFKISMRSGGR